MNREETMFGQLANYVPQTELEQFRDTIAALDATRPFYASLPIHPVDSERMFLQARSTLVGSTAMNLLKKHTGKRVLVVFAAARVKEGQRLWPEIQRIEAICEAAGPDWIILAGGGPSGMKAAREGGKRGGSLVVASHFFSESAVQGKTVTADHNVDIFFPEFYSREFVFVNEADALVVGVCGYGGLGETAGGMSKIQMKMHAPIPVFLLSSDVHRHLIAQTATFQHDGLCNPTDDFFRVLDTAEDDAAIFARIDAYYAARPYLADWRNTMTSVSDPFRLMPPVAAGVPIKT